MIAAIRNKHDQIVKAVTSFLTQQEAPVYWGLANGRTGAMLHLLYAHKHGLLTDFEPFEAAAQELSGIGLQDVDFSYGMGKAGLNWFYQLMFRHELLDQEDTDLLCFDDDYLESFSLAALEAGNYDYLYGGLGAAAYLLYRHGAQKKDFMARVLAMLTERARANHGALPAFQLMEQRPVPEMVNLGLAHGLPAVIRFCLLCDTQDVCREASRSLALQLIRYMRAQVRADKDTCYFPSVVEKGKPAEQDTSRLGWCYGDLGIGFVLYEAGRVWADDELTAFALEVLVHTTQRRANAQTLVHDAGFCPGSAGIAHIYNRLWQLSQLPVFREAADYWMGETLRLAQHADGVAGYKKWDAASNSWVVDYSLIEGVAGIGLVLISYLTGDCSWDYSVMLSDGYS